MTEAVRIGKWYKKQIQTDTYLDSTYLKITEIETPNGVQRYNTIGFRFEYYDGLGTTLVACISPYLDDLGISEYCEVEHVKLIPELLDTMRRVMNDMFDRMMALTQRGEV